EQLGDGGPIGDRGQLLAYAWVGQDVDGGERRVERLQDGDGARGEAAGRGFGGALHEQDHGVIVDRAGDRLADGVGLAGGHESFWLWVVSVFYGISVFSERAWIAPPISVPKTS